MSTKGAMILKPAKTVQSCKQNNHITLSLSPPSVSSTLFALTTVGSSPFTSELIYLKTNIGFSIFLVCVLVENFQKLQQAKEILTNEESRARYDYWRRSKITIPFQQWEALSNSVKTVRVV